MDKFVVIDSYNDRTDARTMVEAKSVAEEWMEQLLEEELTDVSVGIYQLIEEGSFVEDKHATEEYLENCKQDGWMPEYDCIVEAKFVKVGNEKETTAIDDFKKIFSTKVREGKSAVKFMNPVISEGTIVTFGAGYMSALYKLGIINDDQYDNLLDWCKEEVKQHD